ncbi:hypothetical protein JDV09_19860 [Mycobacterium sp. Y57]|nr:hypothetical protein [Mycolicibacterium xanthum]MBX7434335.1 hypothetical protein [Mycolicibacterium xanthum]
MALTAPAAFPAVAGADPEIQPAVDTPAPAPEVLHNIIYRARVDGVSRGATISYRADGDQFQTANPTMVPGRVFEANAVLPASQIANVRVSIEWPYSANLHCEILVDDAVVAQADDFVGPRLTPQREDPDFGSLTCQAPVSGIDNVAPVDPAAPLPADLPPGDPALPADLAVTPDDAALPPA